MMFVLLIIMASLFLGSCSPGEAPPPSTGEQRPVSSPSLDGRLPYYRLPDKVSFCGEPVPLNDPAVREALDREFIIVVWRREQTIMWLKRAQRYFPEITRKLKDKGLPQDLKYVLVVESSFLLKARSSAGALGPWQFMEPTAKRFLLKTNQVIDERLDFAASTDAALKYLKELHRLFHNWPLALAAYNAGEGRVKKAMADQGVKNYYHLSLPEETERYLFRILAAKIVMEDPVKYGYAIPPGELYSPLEIDKEEFTVFQDVTVKRLADAGGTTYRAVKDLNPWIKGSSLPAGTYRIALPKGIGAKFREAYRTGFLGLGSPVAPAPGLAPAPSPMLPTPE